MKKRGRRMKFQLTPLLDLLLIIIFAQFMEVREATARTENVAETKLEVAQSEYEQRRLDLEDKAIRYKERLDADYLTKQTELRDRKDELNESFKQLLAQQEKSGDVLSELFNVPKSVIEEALKLRDPSRAATDQDSQELRERLTEFSKKRGKSIIRHLMTYDEIRKHCDVWELYVNEDGTFQFSDGSIIHDFRAQIASEFEQGMYEVYKSFDHPKA